MTDKQAVLDALQRLPENASLAEITEELRIVAAIQGGREDIVAGRSKTHAEANHSFAFWAVASTASATLPTSLDSFLEHAKQLTRRGQTDAALDLIYDQIDGLLKAAEFLKVNTLLETADVSRFSIDLLLGLLTATLPAKSKLAARRAFFNRVESSLKARGEWEDGLLIGLQS